MEKGKGMWEYYREKSVLSVFMQRMHCLYSCKGKLLAGLTILIPEYFLHYKKSNTSSSLKTQESQYHLFAYACLVQVFLEQLSNTNYYLHTAIDRHLLSIEENSITVVDTRIKAM